MSRHEESLRLLRHELATYKNRLNRIRLYKRELILDWQSKSLADTEERELKSKISKLEIEISRRELLK